MKGLSKLDKYLINIAKNWILLVIWIILIILIFQAYGVCYIHEGGHYISGILSGCDNLTITCSKLSLADNFSYTNGWDSCKSPIVVKNGGRVCNLLTTINSLAGFIFTFILFTTVFLLINYFFKKRVNQLYLKDRRVVGLIIILILAQSISSASIDFAQISACYFNIQISNLVYILSSNINYLFILFVLIFLAIETFNILNKYNKK